MKERLFSLDLLRGVDMFYLVCVSGALGMLLKNVGCPEAAKFCASHPWGGLNLYDMIMTLFIFMCGAAIPLAMRKRLSPSGGYTNEFLRHVAWRFVMLWVLGMFAQGNLGTWDYRQINPFHNTLHAIAIGYAVTALLLPIRSRWFWRVLPFLFCGAYFALLAWHGDYSKEGNLAQLVDRRIYPHITAAGCKTWQSVYTWWLTSLMFIGITVFGKQATEILTRPESPWKKALMLGGYGAALVTGGWFLELREPCIKQIFTTSFTLQSVGWSMVALAVLYVVTDIWKFRRGTWLLVEFGQSALAAYVIGSILRKPCNAVVERLFGGIPPLFPEPWDKFVFSVLSAAVVAVVLLIWRRTKRPPAGRAETSESEQSRKMPSPNPGSYRRSGEAAAWVDRFGRNGRP